MAGQSRASKPVVGKGVGDVFCEVEEVEEAEEAEEDIEDVEDGITDVDEAKIAVAEELNSSKSEPGFPKFRVRTYLTIVIVALFLWVEAATPPPTPAPTITTSNPIHSPKKTGFFKPHILAGLCDIELS